LRRSVRLAFTAWAALLSVAACPSAERPAVHEPPPNDPERAVPEGLATRALTPDSSAVAETSDEARYRRELAAARARQAPPPSPCPAIASEYAEALARARTCEPAKGGSCGALRMSLAAGLEGNRFCGCRVRVDAKKAARLDEIMGRFNLMGCPMAVCACPEDPGPACRPEKEGGGRCQ